MAFTLIIAKLWVCDLSQTGQSGSPPGIGWCHYRSLLQTSEVVCDRGKVRGAKGVAQALTTEAGRTEIVILLL